MFDFENGPYEGSLSLTSISAMGNILSAVAFLGHLHLLIVSRPINHNLMGRFQSVEISLSVLDVRHAEKGYAQHFVTEELR